MIHGTLILGQVLKLVPRAHIESLDKTYSTGRPSRVLSRWSQFGALVFAQLAGRHSLRDVETVMASQSEALAPLGMSPVLRKNNILIALDVTAPNRDNRQERSPIPQREAVDDTSHALHSSPRTVHRYAAHAAGR